MKSILTILFLVGIPMYLLATTYYSNSSGGAFSGTIWSTSPSGPFVAATITTSDDIILQGGTVTFASGNTCRHMTVQNGAIASLSASIAYTGDVTVENGGIVLLATGGSITLQNLTINSGGKLWCNDPVNTGATNMRNIRINGSQLICNGIIGNGSSNDALILQPEATTVTISGSGTIDVSRIRKNASTNSTTNLVIDANVNCRFGTTCIYSNQANSTFNVTVNSGKSLKLIAITNPTGFLGTEASISINGATGLNSGRQGTYTINGTLECEYLYVRAYSANAAFVTKYMVGSTGVVKVNNQLIGNDTSATNSTLASADFEMQSGAKLQLMGSTPTRTISTSTSKNKWTFNDGATVEYGALGQQTIENKFGNYSNCTISGSGLKVALNAFTVNGIFTKSGTATLSINSPTYGTNATLTYADATDAQAYTPSLEWPTTNAPTNVTVNLTGNNNPTLTLNGNKTIGGILSIAAGRLTTGANNLSLGTTASAIIGALGVLNINGGTTDFNSRPVTLQSTSITNGGAIGAITSGGQLNGASNVTVQRYTQAQRGYRTLAHPYTTAQTVSQLTDNFQITGLTSGSLGTYGLATGAPSALYYDGTMPVGTTSVLGRITNSASTDWAVGKGLYVFVRGNGNEGNAGGYTAGTVNGVTQPGGISPVTIDVTNGTINQGDVIVTLSPYTVGGDNFTLVGNPYPCPINLSGVTNIGSFGNVYVYNPTLSAGATTILRGGFEQQASKNIIIPSMGSFYIQATSGTPTTITFKESDKVAGGTSTYSVFGTGATTPTIGLDISTSAGFMDRTKIAFDASATSAATDFYDGGKLGNNLVTFYSLSSERKALGIDYRKAVATDIIPLGIQTATAAKYIISLSEFTDLPNTQVVLIDKLLKTETPLSKVGDSYSFDITADAATKGENRFEIGLTTKTTPIVDLPTVATAFTAKLQGNIAANQLVVKISQPTAKAVTVNLINSLGQIVATKHAGEVTNATVTLGATLQAGMYMVQVTNGEESIILKAVK